MTTPKHQVASDVVAKFGGPLLLAKALKLAPSTVYRWTYPPDKRNGTDGLIPVKHHEAILKAANRLKIELTQADLYPRG